MKKSVLKPKGMHIAKWVMAGAVSLATTGIWAQVYTPTGGVSGTSTAPYAGSGTSTPKAMWEIQLKCAQTTTGAMGGLVVTDDQSSVCPFIIGGPSYTKGDMMYARSLDLMGNEKPLFIVRPNGFTGLGIKIPAAQFNIKSNGVNTVPFRVDAFDGSLNMIINRDKNVGIGNTTVLNAKFQVNNVGSPIAPVQIEYDGGDYTYGLVYKYLGTANYHKALVVSNAAGKDVFVVHPNGYTIIGDMGSCTTLPQYGVADPGYKLVVDNGIITERVKVAVACSADWSDYVFADGYKRKSIADVAAYIQQKKHLPDMPSAEEMVQNGNNLGETDALLLKQIEELWLHSIDQQKALDEMASLKKRTDELEALVKALAEANARLEKQLQKGSN